MLPRARRGGADLRRSSFVGYWWLSIPPRKEAPARRGAPAGFRRVSNMILRPKDRSLGRRSAILAIAAGLLVGGCANIRDQQGYIVDETLVTSVQPGVDDRNSVLSDARPPHLHRASSTPTTGIMCRARPGISPSMPQVRSARRCCASVSTRPAMSPRSTARAWTSRLDSTDAATRRRRLGRDKSFIEELFGNIGAVGSGGPIIPNQP